MAETHSRSFFKAVSWRLTGSLDTFLISWVITDHLAMAGSIASIEIVTKIAYYWLHERIWDRIKWGKKMSKRILIMGLPGSGKTTLAQSLIKELQSKNKTVAWINADEVRKNNDDWDFSEEGRIRQSIRMRTLADEFETDYVVADFVAPLPKMRDNFAADYTIWVDTIESGRFEDTNKMFITPDKFDFRVITQDSDPWAKFICSNL